MKRRTASRLAWGLWLLIPLLIVPTTVLSIGNWGQFPEEDPLFLVVFPMAVLGYATVGALIASRHHRNAIGWLYLAFALNFIIAGFSDQYVIRGVRVDPGSLPFIDVAVWIQNVVFVPAFAVIPIVFLLFPGGRLPSGRWRPVLWAMVAFPAIGLAGLIIRPGEAGGTVLLPNPTGVESLRPVAGLLMTVGGIGSILTAMACVAALVVRFRRARGEERQQVRWLAYVAAAAAVLLLATFATEFLGQEARVGDVLFISFFTMLAVGVPLASGIAILKYRLYDLDIVVQKTVVFGLLAAFIAAVYVVVVVAVPVLVFGVEGGFNLLPFIAAAVIAIAFQPVRRWASHLANRLVYGKRATPYEVLSEFGGRMGTAYAAEDVVSRMARILGEGTGAARAEVWLRVGGQLRREAVWPSESDPNPVAIPIGSEETLALPDVEAVPVRHQGELLGALSILPKRGETVTPASRNLVEDLASQAGLVLRNVRLIEELRASRQRLVAAQDAERRRLERNIHDGAQQQLVALAVQLRLLGTVAEKDGAKAKELADQLRSEAQDALENLRDLARGIYPPLLADKGLAAALESQARKASVPVAVEPNGIGRYPAEVEATAYFCVLEALQNVTKYADAAQAVVRLREEDGTLRFEVQDDGRGFDASTARGTGLQNMEDRVDALGGSLDIRSQVGKGTTVVGRIPLAATEAGT
jgi:signal transduction histidine kinase